MADREQADNFPHKKGVMLNNGRNALEYILRSIERIDCVYLPYYTCAVVMEPIRRLGISYRFYHIDSQFEIADNICLNAYEYIIVNNYFGIKDQYIRSIYFLYGDHMIADCAQAFFCPVFNGLKVFYSARKFVGVADGGVAYLGNEFGEDVSSYPFEPTENHCDHLFIRKEHGAEAGFKNYQTNEMALDNQPVRQMSSFTYDALLNIDYEKVKAKRIRNWKKLNDALFDTNLLKIYPDFECPMIYPYVTDRGTKLRQKLISENVYVARYWPEIMACKDNKHEAELADNVVALPIDQRYGDMEMERIIDLICK